LNNKGDKYENDPVAVHSLIISIYL